MSLTIAAGYLGRMLENTKIERHLLKRHKDILQAIQEVLAVVHEEKAGSSTKKQLSRGTGKLHPLRWSASPPLLANRLLLPLSSLRSSMPKPFPARGVQLKGKHLMAEERTTA